MSRLAYRFARWCPGAPGLWLRRRWFPRLFRSCGTGVLFGRFVDCLAPERISLGNRVVLHNGVVLDASSARREGPAIVLEEDVFVGAGTVMRSGENGSITIGTGANFSSFCFVRAEAPVVIGRNCLVAAYCEVGEGVADHGPETAADPAGSGPLRQLTVGDGCWLGVRAHIKPGVHIGHDTIVGAHATVDRNLPPFAVAVGQPARVIRDRRTE